MASSRVIVLVAGLVVSGGLIDDVLAQSKPEIQSMDRNNDGIVTRAEWQGDDRAFRLNDINKDGVLTGTEVRDTVRGRNRNNADWTTQEFSRLDSNGDNRISADEWRYDSDSFARTDRNHNNVISRGEFLNQGNVSGNRVDRFRDFDSNNDGVIARAEWEESNISFQALDRNRDNQISRDEFRDVAGGAGVASTTGTVDRGPAFRAGYERGLVEGRAAGREDLERNQGFDLEGQRELETADSGYDTRFGLKSDYQTGYREAFRLAYREVWKRH